MASLTVAGADIFYELTGRGSPPIVLIHGGMCDHRDWEPIIPSLAARHAVLTPDLRSHGRSGGDPADFSVERCAADVNRLVEALDLAPALLVGHSFGTRVAAQAAWSAGSDVFGLILLDGSRSLGGKAAPSGSAPQPQPASLEQILAVTVGPHLHGASRARVLETMAAASPAVMMACVTAIAAWDRERADQIFAGLPERFPVLAIQSTFQDQATPRRSLIRDEKSTPYLDFLRQTVPLFDAKLLPDTGHFSMIERPQEVARLLLDFANAITNDRTEPGQKPE